MLSGREIYENFLLRFSDNEHDIMKNLARNIYELNKREFIIEFDKNNIYIKSDFMMILKDAAIRVSKKEKRDGMSYFLDLNL